MTLLFKLILLIFCVFDLTAGQYQDLSHTNVDIHATNSFQGNVITSTTEQPTTKKAGFFKGIKNYFRGTPTEAPTTPSPPTSAVRPIPIAPVTPRPSTNAQLNPNVQLSYPVNPGMASRPTNNQINPNIPPQNVNTVTPARPQSPPGMRDYSASTMPASPSYPLPPSSSTAGRPSPLPPNSYSPPSINSGIPPALPPRNYVGPVTPSPQSPTPPRDFSAPGVNPVTPSRPQSPSGTRDYVAPVTPSRPQSPSPPRDFSAPGVNPVTPPRPQSPSGTRDYVAPVTPSRPQSPSPPRDFSAPGVNPVTPPRPPSPSGTRDYVAPVTPSRPQTPSTGDFPPLGPPRRPSNQDFPDLPSRSSTGSNQPTLHPVWSTRATPTQPSNFNSNQPNHRTPSSRPSARPPTSHSTSSSTEATDAEIREVTEALLSKDVNNPFRYITVNVQGRTQSSSLTDDAPLPLLSINESAIYAIPTINKMRALYNNYELDTFVNEHVTPNERREENEFLDAIMATSVMRRAMLFLQNKGKVTADPRTHRDLLKTIWFNMYSRGGGKIGSSAFEHVFLAEMKDGTVNGLHNWLYFYEQEKLGHLDYKGYIKKFDIGNKGMVMKVRFSLNDVTKPVNSIFVGTSPELDMALYTVCFELRSDRECPISLNQKTFNMKTNTFRYRGKNLIGSAYAEI